MENYRNLPQKHAQMAFWGNDLASILKRVMILLVSVSSIVFKIILLSSCGIDNDYFEKYRYRATLF